MEELTALQYINLVVVEESVQDWNENKPHYLPRTTVEEVRNKIRKRRVDEGDDGKPYICYQSLYHKNYAGTPKPISINFIIQKDFDGKIYIYFQSIVGGGKIHKLNV